MLAAWLAKFDGKLWPQPVCFPLQIQDIIRMSHLLTVFRVSEDNHSDMDVAILQALLKGRNTISWIDFTIGA